MVLLVSSPYDPILISVYPDEKGYLQTTQKSKKLTLHYMFILWYITDGLNSHVDLIEGVNYVSVLVVGLVLCLANVKGVSEGVRGSGVFICDKTEKSEN